MGNVPEGYYEAKTGRLYKKSVPKAPAPVPLPPCGEPLETSSTQVFLFPKDGKWHFSRFNGMEIVEDEKPLEFDDSMEIEKVLEVLIPQQPGVFFDHFKSYGDYQNA